jgi:hypothetical protein
MKENDFMPKVLQSRPVSPELKQLQQPQQDSIRTALRVVGPVIFAVGLICTLIAGVSFFSSFGSFEPPRYFWLAFIGLPMMSFGAILTFVGFMGAITRFLAGETTPVATDTVKYVAEETKGAVEIVSKAVAKGVVEGINEARTKSGDGKD